MKTHMMTIEPKKENQEEVQAVALSPEDLEAFYAAGFSDIGEFMSNIATHLRNKGKGLLIGSTPLPEREAVILRGMGANNEESGLNEQQSSASALLGSSLVQSYSGLLADSVTQAELSVRMGVSGARVRQRISEGSLYVIDRSNTRVFPLFQFIEMEDNGLETLPDLKVVLSAISHGAHPVAVQRFFETPTPDLYSPIAQQEMSPRDWIISGHPINDVLLLAREV